MKQNPIEARIEAAELAAKQDPRYKLLMRRLRRAEKRLLAEEHTMTLPQRDAMWDYFDYLEETNRRLLEIACTPRH